MSRPGHRVSTHRRVQVGEHAGDVIDISLFKFTIMEIGNWVDADQTTGRIIHIPNGKVFTEALANYGKGFKYIWNEIPVLLTFASDWEKAKEILEGISEKYAAHLSKAAGKRLKEASRKCFQRKKFLEKMVQRYNLTEIQ